MRAGGFGLLREAVSVPALIGGSPVALGEIGGVAGNRDDDGDHWNDDDDEDGGRGDDGGGAAVSGDRAGRAPGRSGGGPPGGTEWDIGVGDQRLRVFRPCPKGASKRPGSRRKAQPWLGPWRAFATTSRGVWACKAGMDERLSASQDFGLTINAALMFCCFN
ncbi:MAG: hypothetical protein QM674_07830 [Burkholderiaceae bacterium]